MQVDHERAETDYMIRGCPRPDFTDGPSEHSLKPVLLTALYFFSSSCSSCKTAAAATESSSSRRSRRTPCVERPASRISFAWTRMTLPLCVMIMTSDSSVTCRVATTEPLRSVVFILTTPLPPREVLRYWERGVRLPKPF